MKKKLAALLCAAMLACALPALAWATRRLSRRRISDRAGVGRGPLDRAVAGERVERRRLVRPLWRGEGVFVRRHRYERDGRRRAGRHALVQGRCRERDQEDRFRRGASRGRPVRRLQQARGAREAERGKRWHRQDVRSDESRRPEQLQLHVRDVQPRRPGRRCLLQRRLRHDARPLEADVDEPAANEPAADTSAALPSGADTGATSPKTGMDAGALAGASFAMLAAAGVVALALRRKLAK